MSAEDRRDAASDAPPSRWAWLGRLWGLSTGRFGLIVVIVVLAFVGRTLDFF